MIIYVSMDVQKIDYLSFCAHTRNKKIQKRTVMILEIRLQNKKKCSIKIDNKISDAKGEEV